MEGVIQSLRGDSKASSTREAYATSWALFMQCLAQHEVGPISEYSHKIQNKLDAYLSNFVAWGSVFKKWSHNTITSRLSGVKAHLKTLGFVISDISISSSVMKGVERNETRQYNNAVARGENPKGPSPDPFPPLAIAMGMKVASRGGDPLKVELATAQLCGFWLLMRSSEICGGVPQDPGQLKAVTLAGVKFLQLGCEVDDWREATSVSIFIPNSKRRGEGAIVSMPAGITFQLDLVSNLGEYIENRKRRERVDLGSPLFPNTTPHLLLKFMKSCWAKASPKTFQKSRCTLHSLRHGGATSLSEVGLPPEALKAHGRWSSNAYERYVQGSTGGLLQAADKLVKWVAFLEDSGCPTIDNARNLMK